MSFKTQLEGKSRNTQGSGAQDTKESKHNARGRATEACESHEVAHRHTSDAARGDDTNRQPNDCPDLECYAQVQLARELPWAGACSMCNHSRTPERQSFHSPC
jgi:hypothetical protein